MNEQTPDDVVEAINAELDRLEDARQSGRDVTATTSWQRAYDQIVEHDLGDMGRAFVEVLAVAQGAAPSTPAGLRAVAANYEARRDEVISTLDAFTRPARSTPSSEWSRRTGFRMAETLATIRALSHEAAS